MCVKDQDTDNMRFMFFYFAIMFNSLSLPMIFAKVEIDEEHLELYPYCGKLFGHKKPITKSRIVNSRESEIQYPWVVFLKSSWKVITRHRFLPVTGICSGTAIGVK